MSERNLGRLEIVIGTRYERLTILREIEPVRHGKNLFRRVLCSCDCGNEVQVLFNSLRSRNTQSCGCLRREFLFKHGHSQRGRKTKTYTAWRSMVHRCSNPRNKQFKNYGGRGIQVCERWRDNFENFLADMGEAPTGMTLDRENNNGNYEPSNCRWATGSEQHRNTRRNVWLKHGGRRMVVADWAHEIGIHPKTLRGRLERGWPVEKALSEPVKSKEMA